MAGYTVGSLKSAAEERPNWIQLGGGDTVRSQMIQRRPLVEVQKAVPKEALQLLHSVISERGPKTNPEARYFFYPFIPALKLILLHPGSFTRLVSAVALCVPKGFSRLLHNIYKRILLHPGPFTGFVSAMRTDCVS